MAGVLFLPSAAVLGVAASLQPSAEGVGTHLQIWGMSGCTMLQLTGWPCPMCGMTTTFALAAHGRLVDALLCQPFGLVSLVELARLRGLWRRFWDWLGLKEGWIAAALMGGLLAGWVYKLLVMS